MISDEDIQRAFDFLRDSAPAIAEALYEKRRTEEMRKAIFSQVRLAVGTGTQGERDAEAYASNEYVDAIEALARAAQQYELLRAQREAAIARIDAWRTMQANYRGAGRAA